MQVVFKVKGEIMNGGILSDLQTKARSATSLLVLIDSYGGDVDEAEKVYNYLRSLSIPVTTAATGQCYSAASIILQAGKQRLVAQNAEVMIHNAWIDSYSGNAKQMRDAANYLDVIDERLSLMYATGSRGKLSAESARKLMRQEQFVSGAKALELGLADGFYVGEYKQDNLGKYRACAKINVHNKNEALMNIKEALISVGRALALIEGKAMVTFKVGDAEFTADELIEGAATTAPDGTHTTTDGTIIVVEGGVIKTITAATAGDGGDGSTEQITALQKQIEDMKAENEKYKQEAEAAKTAETNALAKVAEATKSLKDVEPILAALAKAVEDNTPKGGAKGAGSAQTEDELERERQRLLEIERQKVKNKK